MKKRHFFIPKAGKWPKNAFFSLFSKFKKFLKSVQKSPNLAYFSQYWIIFTTIEDFEYFDKIFQILFQILVWNIFMKK